MLETIVRRSDCPAIERLCCMCDQRVRVATRLWCKKDEIMFILVSVVSICTSKEPGNPIQLLRITAKEVSFVWEPLE